MQYVSGCLLFEQIVLRTIEKNEKRKNDISNNHNT